MSGLGRLEERALGSGESNVRELFAQAGERMSRFGAAIRDSGGIQSAVREIGRELEAFADTVKALPRELNLVYRLRDTLICQYVYLSAMLDYMSHGGKSRGSALYTDAHGSKPHASLPDIFTFTLDDGGLGGQVQEVLYRDGRCAFNWRPVRTIPEDDDFFENVWREYRENGNIY